MKTKPACGLFCCMALNQKLWAAYRLEKRGTKEQRLGKSHDTRTKERFLALHLLVSKDVLGDIVIYPNSSLRTLHYFLD